MQLAYYRLLCVVLLALTGIMTFSSVQSTRCHSLLLMNLITGKILDVLLNCSLVLQFEALMFSESSVNVYS